MTSSDATNRLIRQLCARMSLRKPQERKRVHEKIAATGFLPGRRI